MERWAFKLVHMLFMVPFVLIQLIMELIAPLQHKVQLNY